MFTVSKSFPFIFSWNLSNQTFLTTTPLKLLIAKSNHLFSVPISLRISGTSSHFISFFTWLPGNRVFWFPFYLTGISLWAPKSSGLGLFSISIYSLSDLTWLYGIKCHTYTYDSQIFYLVQICPLNSILICNFLLNISTWVSNWHLKSSIFQTDILFLF